MVMVMNKLRNNNSVEGMVHRNDFMIPLYVFMRNEMNKPDRE